VQNFIKLSAAVPELATDFGQLIEFDREYLWNGLSNRQAEKGVMNCDSFRVRRKQFGELLST